MHAFGPTKKLRVIGPQHGQSFVATARRAIERAFALRVEFEAVGVARVGTGASDIEMGDTALRGGADGEPSHATDPARNSLQFEALLHGLAVQRIVEMQIGFVCVAFNPRANRRLQLIIDASLPGEADPVTLEAVASDGVNRKAPQVAGRAPSKG
jgi:hypothetical protein